MRTASAVGAETATIIGGTNRSGFLHHLNRDPARQHDNALTRGRTFVCKRAGKLVQRIVTTNVLAHGNQATCWVPKTCSVYRAGLLIK